MTSSNPPTLAWVRYRLGLFAVVRFLVRVVAALPVLTSSLNVKRAPACLGFVSGSETGGSTQQALPSPGIAVLDSF